MLTLDKSEWRAYKCLLFSFSFSVGLKTFKITYPRKKVNGRWRLKIPCVDQSGCRGAVGERDVEEAESLGTGNTKTKWCKRSQGGTSGKSAGTQPTGQGWARRGNSPLRLPIPTWQHCPWLSRSLACWPALCQVLWVGNRNTCNRSYYCTDLPYFQYIVPDFKNIFTTTLRENRVPSV